MKNKVVYLQFKGSTETYTFTGVSSLFKKFDKEDTGISRGALWNALSKGKGEFENKYCKIWYKKLEISPAAWE